MLRHFLLLALCIWLAGVHAADLYQPAYRMQLTFHHGFIIAHRSALYALQQDHVRQIGFSLMKQTDGSRQWHHVYDFPLYGMAYRFFDMGNAEEVGYAHALMPVLDFQLVRWPSATLRFGFGIGLGYCTKTFHAATNYRNLAMGSHFSFAFGVTTGFEWKISRQAALYTALAFNHFSNGAIKTPNLGFNVPSVSLGYLHSFGTMALPEKKKIILEKKPWRKSVFLGMGIKQRYPVNGPYYGVLSLAMASLKQISNKSALGAGLDLHYDESLQSVLRSEDQQKVPVRDAIRAGLCASYELIFSRFSLLFQKGHYLYSKHTSEGKFYQRLGMRYKFSDHWFVCINLRSHFGKADFFEIGTGIQF
jgi:hypothetical protein